MPTPTSSLTDEEADSIIGRMPGGYLATKQRKMADITELVTDYGPLTQEHISAAEAFIASDEVLGVRGAQPKAMRATHHRAAQLLAVGTDEIIVARLCNYHTQYISTLRQTPAFQELETYYKNHVVEEWADFVAASAGLSMNALGELQARLEEDPKSFTPNQLMELLKTTADRSGNAPMTKSVNINVNAGLGDRLDAARERLRQLTGG